MKIEMETNQDLRFESRRMGVRFTISLTGLRDWWGGGGRSVGMGAVGIWALRNGARGF